jgi:hypothetical protein
MIIKDKVGIKTHVSFDLPSMFYECFTQAICFCGFVVRSGVVWKYGCLFLLCVIDECVVQQSDIFSFSIFPIYSARHVRQDLPRHLIHIARQRR